MTTAWEQYSLLIDISSILQERAHFCTSTTNQRQLMLHTTSFMYAARKPSVYFTSVFKVHHLKRGAWTVLYSTRKSRKGTQISEKAVRLTQSIQTRFGCKSLVTWYTKEIKHQKLGPVFPGEGSPIPLIVHWFWKCKSFGYNSPSVC